MSDSLRVAYDLGTRVLGIPVKRLNVSIRANREDLDVVLHEVAGLETANLESYLIDLGKAIEWASKELGGDILLSKRGYWVTTEFDARYHYDHMGEIPALEGHETPARGRSEPKEPDLPKTDVAIFIGTREVGWIEDLKRWMISSRMDGPVPHGLPVVIDGERKLIRWKKARGHILVPAVFPDDSPEKPEGIRVHLEIGSVENGEGEHLRTESDGDDGTIHPSFGDEGGMDDHW